MSLFRFIDRIYQKLTQRKQRKQKVFRLSLRFKLAFPVLILVSLLIFLVFRTTFVTVRELVLERNESRLQAIAEVFAETIKVPLILNNQQVLYANIEWMAKRPDVVEVRVEDSEGVIVGGDRSTYASLPPPVIKSDFLGVMRVTQDTYAVAVPILAHQRRLGRVLIMFSQEGFEGELREIFEERLLVAFLMALGLALVTAGFTWLAIRPLLILKRTAQQIVGGDLTARAHIESFDEIADLGDAFNEMVARLTKSLDNLRSRTEALQESEEKYRLVVENASDIIFMLTKEGEIILLNKGFSGCTREEFIMEGLPLLISLNDEASKKAFEEALESTAKDKQPVLNIPITHFHKGTHAEISYLTNLTPILDQHGDVKMVQAVMRDITELKRIEIMKESLIRDVAHELKTPTAKFEMAVNWFEKEMSKSGDLHRYKEVVEILKNNIDRLMRTITSIMDLSRLESGMHGLEAADLDLNDVLRQVVKDMDPICSQKGLELKSSLCRKALPIRGDFDMLYRLFVNLIGNAAKFTEKGSITVRSEDGPENLIVTVTDTGIGIEQVNLEKIFDRFVQKTASSLGIGVGLTISRDIAAMHQGRIWAESGGVGRGSVFKVEIPKAK